MSIRLIPNDSTNGITVEKEMITISKYLNILSSDDNEIKLDLVNDRCLNKIIEFMKYRYNNPNATTELDQWNNNFCNIEKEFLFELMTTATYLEIDSLLCIIAKYITSITKNLSEKEIMEFFNLHY